jgi:hypothetical protein
MKKPTGTPEPEVENPVRAADSLRGLAKSHPVAGQLMSLAGHHLERGEYAEAAPLFKYVLEITERTLGKGHPMVVAIRKRYDETLRLLADRGGAEDEPDTTPRQRPGVATSLDELEANVRPGRSRRRAFGFLDGLGPLERESRLG